MHLGTSFTMAGSSTSRFDAVVLLVAFAALVLICGCYFPNPKSVKDAEDVRQIQIGVDTREEVLKLLGRPQVVDSPELYVYAWEESSGYLVVAAGYSGFGGPIGVKGTRALVQFDAEGRVLRIESSDPKTEPKLPKLACRPVPGLCGRDRLGTFGPLAVTFSPVGRGLAIIHGSRKTGSCIEDPVSGRVLTSFDYHPKICAGAVFSSDGSRLAAIGAREPLVVWNLADGSELRHFDSMDDEWITYCRTSVAFSADSSRIASHGPDGGLVVWEVETGALLLEQTLEGGTAHDPSFAPDGARLAAGHGTGVVMLDATTGSMVTQRPGHPDGEWLNIPTFSPDGEYLVIASCAHVEIWSIARDREFGWDRAPESILFLPFPRSANVFCDLRLAFSEDGSLLGVVTGDAVTLVEVPSGVVRHAARLPVSARPMAVDMTSSRLAIALEDKLKICDIPLADQRN
jgi:outer membrane protein assembly factor BamE (lipoprotein component of BamABCDE complex)